MHRDSKLVAFIKSIVRILLFTALGTLLGFAVGLFCGIVTTIIFGLIRHIHPDMTMAYRYVAAPFGIAALVITFCVMLFLEIRNAFRPTDLARTSARTS